MTKAPLNSQKKKQIQRSQREVQDSNSIPSTRSANSSISSRTTLRDGLIMDYQTADYCIAHYSTTDDCMTQVHCGIADYLSANKRIPQQNLRSSDEMYSLCQNNPQTAGSNLLQPQTQGQRQDIFTSHNIPKQYTINQNNFNGCLTTLSTPLNNRIAQSISMTNLTNYINQDFEATNQNGAKYLNDTIRKISEDDTISTTEDQQPSVIRQNLLGPLSFEDLYYT